jgi:hypothetical protein
MARPASYSRRAVTSVAFSPDGGLLATGAARTPPLLCPFGQSLLDTACARVRELPLVPSDRQRLGSRVNRAGARLRRGLERFPLRACQRPSVADLEVCQLDLDCGSQKTRKRSKILQSPFEGTGRSKRRQNLSKSRWKRFSASIGGSGDAQYEPTSS